MRTDDIITIAAIKIRGNRILTSERFEAVVRPDAGMQAGGDQGASPASGRCCARPADLEGAAKLPAFRRRAAAGRVLRRFRYRDAGQVHPSASSGSSCPIRASRCPSSTTSASTATRRPTQSIDLSFAAILKDLNIPPLAQHDAFNDALMTAMMYVALRDLKERGVRIARARSHAAVFDPTGA